MKDQLELALREIGWSLSDQGCDHFGIIDNTGEHSGYMFRGTTITKGGSYRDNVSLQFGLAHCDVVVMDEGDHRLPRCVSIVPKGSKGNSALLHFYNLDEKKSERKL